MIVSRSSEPLPARIMPGATPCSRAAASQNAVPTRVGVAPEPFAHRRADRLGDSWRRRIWVLVGVELDEPAALRLLARHVAGHPVDVGLEVAAHPAVVSGSGVGGAGGVCSDQPVERLAVEAVDGPGVERSGSERLVEADRAASFHLSTDHSSRQHAPRGGRCWPRSPAGPCRSPAPAGRGGRRGPRRRCRAGRGTSRRS